MFKIAAVCSGLLALGIGASYGGEREAILQKIEVPGTTFDLVVATAKPRGAVYDLSKSPDALAIHLIGNKLWVGFDDTAKMFETLDLISRPIGSFHFERTEAYPVAVYVISKADTLAVR